MKIEEKWNISLKRETRSRAERERENRLLEKLEPDLTEPDIQDMISNITKPVTVQEVPLVPLPTIFKGAITRQRAKVLQHKFNESMILASYLVQVEDSSLKKDKLKSEPAEKNQASSEDICPFIPEQGHNNLMIITIEDQFA
ncbi:hypothetical protein F2Q70_00002156 [Brassica cretica]|uniref:Uncharacterized protein n=1 Tax=Brassica cretica TaxID=69181 RepID=A0A8S9IT88_BRACR|nr:hypothetical protein F2Q70_00002156 [Brassica cretica]